MRVALTGASGFIGSRIARALERDGHTVTALVRATSRRDHIEDVVDRFVVGTHDDQSVWGDLLDGAGCVVHNSVDWSPLRATPADLGAHLRSNLESSIALLGASSPRQFVFMSTIAVHHDMHPRERTPDGLGSVDWLHPLRPSSVYGAYKASVEAFLWAEHFGAGRNTCALRPCAVYGVDPVLERSHGYKVVRALRGGEPYNRPGGGKCVHVDDVADATAACVGNESVAGKPFNLVDCYTRWGDWAVMAQEILGTSVEIDLSSPDRPANMFEQSHLSPLGVRLDRGRAGVREHLKRLIEAMDAAGV